MKILIFLLSTTVLFSCGQTSENETTNNSNSEVAKNHVAVYDFHTEHRCETCLAIEKATKETLKDKFKAQSDDETIIFKLMNAEADENAEIAEKYDAFGTTLAITIFKDGKEEIIDITNWAFDAIHGDNFKSELTEKLNEALAKL